MASRRLVVEFIGDTSGLERSASKARRSVDGMGGSAQRAGRGMSAAQGGADRLAGSLKTAAKAAAGAALAYASISSVKDAVKTTEDLGKQTLLLNKNFGLAVNTAGRWAAVTQARGVDGKQLTMGFKALASQTRNAEQGSKGAIQAFRDLGITQQELAKHGNDFQWVLGAVADGMRKLPAGTDRAALSAKLFGRSWVSLAPLLRGGKKDMEDQLRAAQEYGAVLSGKTIKDVKEAVRAQREHNLAMLGLKVAIGSAVLPYVTRAEHALTRFVKGFHDGTGAGGAFRDQLEKLRDPARDVARFIGNAVGGIAKFAGDHPGLAAAAAKFAIIGGAAAKIAKLTGAGEFIKLGFGRGNTPMTPLFVKDIGGGGVGGGVTRTGGKLPAVAAFGGPAAATGFAAATNQSGAVGGKIGGASVVGDGAPAGNQGLTKLVREKTAAVLGVQKVKPLDLSAFTASLRLMEQAVSRSRSRIEGELERRLPKVVDSVRSRWQDLAAASDHSFSAISGTVARNMKTIRSRLGNDSSAGKEAIADNFLAAERAIQRNMDRGVTSTSSGMRQIRALLASALQEFGFTVEQAKRYAQGQDPLTGKDNSAGNVRPGGYAAGGWIGQPGRAGRDTVPTMLGVGEAVLNRHQQRYVEPALRMAYGFGLNGLFGRVTTPHYHASGGIATPKMQQGLGAVTTVGQQALKLSAAAARELLKKARDAVVDGPAGTMDGHKVAGWILHILRQARADGVQFTVSDGIRDLAGQWRAYWNHGGEAGVRAGIVARPGTSNHGGTTYPSGAVDIGSGWAALDAWLRAHHSKLHHYGNPLDPYHFSARGNARGGFIRGYASGGWVSGAGSWFNDGATKTGLHGAGIAVNLPGLGYRATFNKYARKMWDVVAPNGRRATLRQVDEGPSASATTGRFRGRTRLVDFLPDAVRKLGLNTANFPTDATFRVRPHATTASTPQRRGTRKRSNRTISKQPVTVKSPTMAEKWQKIWDELFGGQANLEQQWYKALLSPGFVDDLNVAAHAIGFSNYLVKQAMGYAAAGVPGAADWVTQAQGSRDDWVSRYSGVRDAHPDVSPDVVMPIWRAGAETAYASTRDSGGAGAQPDAQQNNAWQEAIIQLAADVHAQTLRGKALEKAEPAQLVTAWLHEVMTGRLGASVAMTAQGAAVPGVVAGGYR